MKHISNPKLKNRYPANFKGTPIADDGKFRNLGIQYIPGFKDAMKWQFSKKEFKQEKKNDKWRPVIHTDEHFLHEHHDQITWLGHASFFIQLNGKRILIDPVFNKATVVPRLIPFPCNPNHLKNIDYLLISHNHRDHCDTGSLNIVAENNPHLKVLTGLGQEKLLGKIFNSQNIQSAGWFQEYNLIEENFRITYTPARHWSKRGLTDDNKTLWGGFMIEVTDKKIYFMGDSGYAEHFKMIAEVFPDPDYCLMGVGAFRPEWFMGPSHISPVNAVKAVNEMGGKNLIPMHYATFDLSDEPISEPIRILKDLESKNELIGQLRIAEPGQLIRI